MSTLEQEIGRLLQENQLDSLPSQASPVDLLALAKISGAVHAVAMTDSLRVFQAANRQRSAVMGDHLGQLQEKGLVTAAEATQLEHLVRAVTSSSPAVEMLKTVKQIHEGLAQQKEVSPVALVISSIALDSLTRDVGQREGISTRSLPLDDVSGALAGAALGQTLFPKHPNLGALLGGIVGGAASSIASAL